MRGIAARVAASALLAASICAAAEQCASGLYIIVARGSGEPKGTGVTGMLADRIGDQIKGSKVVPIDYPDSKVAIMGYSQGAQLSTDALCGATGTGFEDAKPVAMDAVKDDIVAVVLFGDPTHIANTTYDRGTSVNDGIFKRNDTSAKVCQEYADRMVSYCDTGDIFCDAGDDRTVHTSYVPRYGDEVVDYVVGKYKDATAKGATTTTMSASAVAASATSSSSSSSASTTTADDSQATPEGADPGGNRGHVSAASGPVARRGLLLGAALVATAVLQAL